MIEKNLWWDTESGKFCSHRVITKVNFFSLISVIYHQLQGKVLFYSCLSICLQLRSLSRRGFIQKRVYPKEGLSKRGSIKKGVSTEEGLSRRGSLQKGVSVHKGSLSRRLCPDRSLYPGVMLFWPEEAFGLPKPSLFSNYKVMLFLFHLRVNWIQIQVTWYLSSHWLVLNDDLILLHNIFVWRYFTWEIFFVFRNTTQISSKCVSSFIIWRRYEPPQDWHLVAAT